MKLKSINKFLKFFGFILILFVWDGEGKKLPTEIKIFRLKNYIKKYKSDTKTNS